MMHRSEKLRRSAEGMTCTMGSPMCTGDSNTVAWRHSNRQRHGKGRGIKAHDIFGFYGCQGCEDWYSLHASREDGDAAFAVAHERSLLKAAECGALNA